MRIAPFTFREPSIRAIGADVSQVDACNAMNATPRGKHTGGERLSVFDNIPGGVKQVAAQVDAMMYEQNAFRLVMAKIKIRSSLPRTSILRKQAQDNKNAFGQ